MGKALELETDFAAAMQELSAEATDSASVKRDVQASAEMSILISAVHGLGQRLEALEESIFRKLESLQFEKIELQLTAIRDNETVNQKLFDSLHQELISYRDNFVRDALQKPFIRDLLVLFDDLSVIASQVDVPLVEGESTLAQDHSRENLNNMLHFLLEILHRLDVTEIEEKERVDRNLHRVITLEPTESEEENGLIVRRLKRGFTWQGRVLRPEEVVAKRFR
ncbi:MAG TPA: nucleotide exchange factor GrpE [Chthoniobacterales bacterium]